MSGVQSKYINNELNVKKFLIKTSRELREIDPREEKHVKSNLHMHLSSNSTNDENMSTTSYLQRSSSMMEVESFYKSKGIDHNQTSNLNLIQKDNGFNLNLFNKYSFRIPTEYLIDIWETLISEEAQFIINSPKNRNYFEFQKDINDKMRAILIDWLVEVHLKFNLSPETLFTSVMIIDRYLNLKLILRSHLQLLGVTALFIACKYEEVLVPDLKDFVFITDKTYSKQDILQMENQILKTLQFNVTTPTSIKFFEILALNFNFTELEFFYGRFLLENFLLNVSVIYYDPSILAVAVCYIILKINNYPNYRDIYSLLNKHSTSKILKECAREVLFTSQNKENISFKSVFKKFSLKEYMSVSVNGLDFYRRSRN